MQLKQNWGFSNPNTLTSGQYPNIEAVMLVCIHIRSHPHHRTDIINSKGHIDFITSVGSAAPRFY